ncbi:hypothetical protein [Bifidobacterium italicum]|uniref:hypothetical protein n=1 Tax=Bifidobacterium italicum TaxID=1960968 RepID=UPI00105661DD|nr:hypothetical protein [Bifidobacterium italicum]
MNIIAHFIATDNSKQTFRRVFQTEPHINRSFALVCRTDAGVRAALRRIRMASGRPVRHPDGPYGRSAADTLPMPDPHMAP